MVEVLGTKGRVERVIATISRRDGRIVVDAEEPDVKRELLRWMYPSNEEVERLRSIVGDEETAKNRTGGWPSHMRVAVEWNGRTQEIAIAQRRDDLYYLEALYGPRRAPIAGYEHVWIRPAGETWEEEIELGNEGSARK